MHLAKIHIITITKTTLDPTITKVIGIGLMVDTMLEFLYTTIVLIIILIKEIAIQIKEQCIIVTTIKTIAPSMVF